MGRITNWDTPVEKANDSVSSKNLPGFFNLVDDGDEAIVRFMYSNTSEFEVYTVHPLELVTSTGKKWYPKVYCLREDINQPVDNCPFCQMGEKIQDRFYIKLIQYVKDESGHIIPQEKIWDRGISYAHKLKNLMNEYGPLCECVFKVRRNGEKGKKETTYDIMYGSPNIYTPELYPKITNAFSDYSILGDTVLMKSKEEMLQFIQTGSFPLPNRNVSTSPVETSPQMSTNSATPAYNNSPNNQMNYQQPTAYPSQTPPYMQAPVSDPWETPFNNNNFAPAPQNQNSIPWDNSAQSMQRPVRN